MIVLAPKPARFFNMKFQPSLLFVFLTSVGSTKGLLGSNETYNDTSALCHRNESYMKSRYVPYYETYNKKTYGIFYQTRVRVNYKLEYVPSRRTISDCCEQYERDGELCRPICEPPCESNSTCTAPNSCTCNAGYVSSLNGSSLICEPLCEPPCESNSACTAPNSCTCSEGYVPLSNGSYFTCEPLCEPACESNSSCTAPNSCTCDPGYRPMSTNGSSPVPCEPICEPYCLFGTCVSPGACSCDDGFAIDPEGRCSPICEPACANGTCVLPNLCNCDPGYDLQGAGVCEPYCETCDNGICVAPDVCQCAAGYVKVNNSDASDCETSCEGECSGNGECVDDKGTCVCVWGFRGGNCSEPSVCLVIMGTRSRYADKVSYGSRGNKTFLPAFTGAPFCHECIYEVDGQIPCFRLFNQSKGGVQVGIGCFVSIDLPCATYEEEDYDVRREVLKVSVSVAGLAVLIIALMSTMAYFVMVRSRRKSIGYQGNALQRQTTSQRLLPEQTRL